MKHAKCLSFCTFSTGLFGIDAIQAHIERFSVSCMHFFLDIYICPNFKWEIVLQLVELFTYFDYKYLHMCLLFPHYLTFFGECVSYLTVYIYVLRKFLKPK